MYMCIYIYIYIYIYMRISHIHTHTRCGMRMCRRVRAHKLTCINDTYIHMYHKC